MELEGNRIILRNWRIPEDVTDALEFYSDPEVSRYVDRNFLTDPKEVELRLSHYLRHFDEHGFTAWAVVEKATKRLIGACGLVTYNPWKEPELGYIFARKAWGQGYASEAADLSIEYGFSRLRLPRIIASPPHKDNVASIKILEKLGFRILAETRDQTTKEILSLTNPKVYRIRTKQ
jgi:ribosomal-protein-alanine N-acetyltransferase